MLSEIRLYVPPAMQNNVIKIHLFMLKYFQITNKFNTNLSKSRTKY